MSTHKSILAKLKSFPHASMELVNESHLHEGHIPGHHSESHFRLTMVSEKFVGLTRMQRQRLIHDLLADDFKKELHALTMKLLAPGEDK